MNEFEKKKIINRKKLIKKPANLIITGIKLYYRSTLQKSSITIVVQGKEIHQ